MNISNFNIKYKMYNFLIVILLIILLDISYQMFVSPLFNNNVISFGHYGYPIGNFSLSKFYIASFFLLLLLFFLPDKIETPSSLIIVFYYFFSTVPFFSLYTLNLTNNKVFFIELISIFIFYIFTWPSHFFYNRISCNDFILKNISLYNKILFFITSIILFYVIIKFVIHTKVDSLLDVYSQRKIFNESGFVINYLISFLSFGVLSFLFYLYMIRKSLIYLFTLFVITFLIFLSTGSKLIFGSTFLIFFLLIIYRGYLYSYKVSLVLVFIIIISLFVYLFFNKDIMISLLIRRTFILPAQIFDLYFSFFTSHDFNFLSAYLHNLINTPYNISASHIIGSKFFLSNTHANSGIISDAYANFGIIGVIIFSIILCLIMIFLNFLNSKFGNTLTPLFAGIAISLTNSGLLGVFLYQIFPIIFIFFIFYLISIKGKVI